MLPRLVVGATVMAVAFAAVAKADPGGGIRGRITITDANGAAATAEAIVYVVGFTEPPGLAPPVTIAQRNRTFVPDLVAVTAGDRVSFPNDDKVLHNVFSQTGTQKFDLGSFKKGSTKLRTFRDVGAIDVYCNIHPEMAATILVLPNRRHSRRNADGTYRIDGVPAGSWTVLAYVRRAAKPATARVTVVAGEDTTVDFALVRGAELPHLNKYGEKYGDDPAGEYP